MQQAIYKPSDLEIGHLQQILSHPGYQVLEKINLSEIDMMQIAFMEVDTSTPNFKETLAAKHALAKGGAQFYRQVCERVSGYVNRIKEARDQDGILPDITETLFSE